ncbi:hypothetical protein ACFFGT_16085 [Mucilaginibacter angelicae]|uniref:Uncharacterized protein n=1 Tax=Mucilaginibacter angelicae TaxID=869718 RepID=A0ABV6L8H0_9SPHI
MNFNADFYLNYYAQSKKRASFWASIAGLLLPFILGTGFYLHFDNYPVFIFECLVCVVLSAALIYSVTVIEGRNLNKIISQIEINQDTINFTTYSYGFSIFKINARQLEMNKGELTIKEVVFPFNSFGLDHNKTLKLVYNGADFFLVYDCFPVELKAQLTALA